MKLLGGGTPAGVSTRRAACGHARWQLGRSHLSSDWRRSRGQVRVDEAGRSRGVVLFGLPGREWPRPGSGRTDETGSRGFPCFG